MKLLKTRHGLVAKTFKLMNTIENSPVRKMFEGNSLETQDMSILYRIQKDFQKSVERCGRAGTPQW